MWLLAHHSSHMQTAISVGISMMSFTYHLLRWGPRAVGSFLWFADLGYAEWAHLRHLCAVYLWYLRLGWIKQILEILVSSISIHFAHWNPPSTFSSSFRIKRIYSFFTVFLKDIIQPFLYTLRNQNQESSLTMVCLPTSFQVFFRVKGIDDRSKRFYSRRMKMWM